MSTELTAQPPAVALRQLATTGRALSAIRDDPKPANELAELAALENRLPEELANVQRRGQEFLDAVLRLGDLLRAAQRLIMQLKRPGGMEGWLAEHEHEWHLGYRSAKRYMQLAGHCSPGQAWPSQSLSGLLRAIRAGSDSPDAAAPPPPKPPEQKLADTIFKFSHLDTQDVGQWLWDSFGDYDYDKPEEREEDAEWLRGLAGELEVLADWLVKR